MAGILHSLKRLAAFIVFIIITAGITIVFFEVFIAGAINLSAALVQLGNVSIIFFFSAIAIFFLNKSKKLLTPHIGLQAATITQFLLLALAFLITAFITVAQFPSVNASTLLASAGIISVTVGLIISTFVGGILSGALVFTTYQFKIGEDVMVNNMPGKVTDMTALVMRIRTDVGQITIPNSAIASGGVIITSMREPQPVKETRLPYIVGDRVITSYRNEEGTVKEVTAFHTTVLLDSGRQITFLNNGVLIGAVPIAKIAAENSEPSQKSVNKI